MFGFPDDEMLTVEEIEAILTNPIYAGLGPFPPLVDDELWARAGAVHIREFGLEDFISKVRGGLIDVGLEIPSFEKIRSMRKTDPEALALKILHICRSVNPPRPFIEKDIDFSDLID